MKENLAIVIYFLTILVITINMEIDYSSSWLKIKNSKKSESNEVKENFSSKGLPEGFVYVDEIDPMIINNLRYYTTQNFVGEVLPGYFTNRAIMTLPAAVALKNVNQ